MQYVKLTDPRLLAERVLDIVVVHGLVLRNQAFKVTLPAQLVLLRSYNIEIKGEQMFHPAHWRILTAVCSQVCGVYSGKWHQGGL